MANTEIETTQINFIILPTRTVLEIFYTSNEPGNAIMGGGWVNKSFGPEVPVEGLITEAGTLAFLSWERGRAYLTPDELGPVSTYAAQYNETRQTLRELVAELNKGVNLIHDKATYVKRQVLIAKANRLINYL